MKLRIGKTTIRVGKKLRKFIEKEAKGGRLPSSVLERGANADDLGRIITVKGRKT